MELNNKLALIVAYYLSKFDAKSIRKLGFKNATNAFNSIGTSLSIKANTIKNLRDEFDSVHDNPRQGWYQRPLRPSRVKVIEAFQNLSEDELYEIVIEIIHNVKFKDSDECSEITGLISDDRYGNSARKKELILRGPTGKKAEGIL
ncbi:hypothetical protein [Paenibacillus ihbetae]|uniref:Uncharacterized protein n=1 Tax=Paenibacillus ihbetae TaxID=1870820 RepID=A0ABX3JPG9_9BACL|nr:hypothetical protein [Paenibacillus ihbetae]OOC58739.1 hypothetical protein BBD40_23975 [Paenibacillus ihbetae]